MAYRILIVDDETSWLSSHKEIIESSFQEVFTIELASSAKQALEVIKEFAPQLVISDMEMEKIENGMYAGEYLIKTVKDLYPDIVTIIISGAPDGEKIAERNCVKAFIPKWSLASYPLQLKLTISEIFDLKYEIC
jgi:DNA-binding NtrC family response regulator